MGPLFRTIKDFEVGMWHNPGGPAGDLHPLRAQRLRRGQRGQAGATWVWEFCKFYVGAAAQKILFSAGFNVPMTTRKEDLEAFRKDLAPWEQEEVYLEAQDKRLRPMAPLPLKWRDFNVVLEPGVDADPGRPEDGPAGDDRGPPGAGLPPKGVTSAPDGPPYRLGIDIGGTFTDLVLLREGAPPVVAKVLSTPHSFARGVLDGVRALLHGAGVAPSEVADLVHGTTVATNALLQRRGARTGLLTTAGFRDLLEIRRLRLPRLYDLAWEKPAPLVERALRLEVSERLDHTGAVVRPLDEAGAREAIARLRQEGVQAVAVCLLHAYADGAHEALLGALLHESLPGVYVALSHQVLPQIQEYERLSTTVVDAYVGPVVARYLEEMEGGLAGLGLSAPLRVMQSNGGSMSAGVARRRPARLIESGPAAGAVAVAALARGATGGSSPAGGVAQRGGTRLPREAGRGALLALDMGGTTAKAALILDGALPLAAEAEIGAGVTATTRLNRGRRRPQPPRGGPGGGRRRGREPALAGRRGGIAGGPPRAPGPRPARPATGGAGLPPP